MYSVLYYCFVGDRKHAGNGVVLVFTTDYTPDTTPNTKAKIMEERAQRKRETSRRWHKEHENNNVSERKHAFCMFVVFC